MANKPPSTTGTRFRIPLPAKVFLSYLLVLAAGAAPTIFYLEGRFRPMLTAEVAAGIAERADLMAQGLARLPAEQRLPEVRRLARMTFDRLTLMDERGRVLFDSRVDDVGQLEGHGGRPEVQVALGHEHPDAVPAEDHPRVAIAQRTSDTTGANSLYAAVALDARSPGHVLRLAVPLARTHEAADELWGAFRNSQAAALTMAILFSLLALFVLVRPMQRLVAAARALSSGDYTAAPEGLRHVADLVVAQRPRRAGARAAQAHGHRRVGDHLARAARRGLAHPGVRGRRRRPTGGDQRSGPRAARLARPGRGAAPR